MTCVGFKWMLSGPHQSTNYIEHLHCYGSPCWKGHRSLTTRMSKSRSKQRSRQSGMIFLVSDVECRPYNSRHDLFQLLVSYSVTEKKQPDKTRTNTQDMNFIETLIFGFSLIAVQLLVRIEAQLNCRYGFSHGTIQHYRRHRLLIKENIIHLERPIECTSFSGFRISIS